MASTPPSKDIDWQTELKRKSQQFVVYKKPMLQIETNTALGWKSGKRFTKLMNPKTGRGSNTYIRLSRLQT
jgi:hypothetical protein